MNRLENIKKFNDLTLRIIERSDGSVEWICKHGIGHTIWFDEDSSGVHGCDGCCKRV